MVDIDHFKHVNDNVGHPAGDEVLRAVAARLCKALSPNDAMGRYGGEEFLAVLSGVGQEEVLQVGERIRAEVVQKPICCDQGEISVSCSIGVAVSPTPADLERLICAADSALYRAKSSGWNRVEMKPPLLRGYAKYGVALFDRAAQEVVYPVNIALHLQIYFSQGAG